MALLKSMGKNPWGEHLKKVEHSANYKGEAFQNQSETIMLQKRGDMFKMFWKFMNKPANTKPPRPLPSVKTDLNNLPDKALVWFGHSSYLIKINGKHILVDPVFSGYASPFKMGSSKNFDGSNVYSVDDMLPIDVLLITHDHYDHLDYHTVLRLQNKTKHIVTSLGVTSHLKYWGIPADKITELDWHDSTAKEGLQFTAAPARHFSGRSFVRSKTLWSSFILKAGDCKIYIGADSGYDKHFKEIGDQYGPFDLAILECGQYNEAWKAIHMMPEETALASTELRATTFMPVHWAKFSLSLHPWNEPIERVTTKADEMKLSYTTPKIGEPIIIGEHYPTSKWWKEVM